MPPQPSDGAAHWAWSVEDASSLATIRREIRDRATGQSPAPADGRGPVMGNVVERLLLVFSELATNGLRHAAPPVEVSIARVDGGWLVVAADRAPGAVPNRHAPDPRRSGQHGLIVVDAVSDATGYYTDDRCKHVWATVPDEPTPRLRERLAGLG